MKKYIILIILIFSSVVVNATFHTDQFLYVENDQSLWYTWWNDTLHEWKYQQISGKSYTGIWHLHPRGIVASVGNQISCEGGPSWAGYEYDATFWQNDGKTYYGIIHINANEWVNSDASTVGVIYAPDGRVVNNHLQLKETGTAGELSISLDPNGHDDFSYHYNGTQYPYEYGEICKWKGGKSYSRLWDWTGSGYYYIVVNSDGYDSASFMRVWQSGSNYCFDVGKGTRNGNYFYADYVYNLNHSGAWELYTVSGSPHKWRFDISTGAFREWSTGSEDSPNNTETFSVVTGGNTTSDWTPCDCEGSGECACDWCKNDTPCENMPPD